jgi:hypothetical protein
MEKKIKAWAITSPKGVLVGGGMKICYTPLCVYSTRLGAKQHLSSDRNDIVVPCVIILPKIRKTK